MSYDVQGDFSRFRKVLQGYIKRSSAMGITNDVTAAYQSIDAFEARYPSPDERTRMLDELEERQECLGEIEAECQAFFKAFLERPQNHT